MKVKVFEVVLQKVGDGESSAVCLEGQLNNFLKENPRVILTATHMNTVTLPPERNAMRGSEASEPSAAIFVTLFYSDN
jgi:hypothetical protein